MMRRARLVLRGVNAMVSVRSGPRTGCTPRRMKIVPALRSTSAPRKPEDLRAAGSRHRGQQDRHFPDGSPRGLE
jgi:hypothetical protein